MKKNNQYVTQFFIWLRNGIAFCISWFLILLLIYNSFYNIPSIKTDSLIKLVFFVIGGVLLFCTFFTQLFIRRWSFVSRLTGFMILFSVYESVAFYYLGVFKREGTFNEWLIFAGIVMVLYLLCITIYHLYSKQKGELYTQKLQKYQEKRSAESGK